MHKIRVSIYEDNLQLGETLSWIINATPDLSLTAVHPNAIKVLEEVKAESPDVILMDIEMPEVTGIEAVKNLSAHLTNLPKILMFTVFEDADKIFEAIKGGAVGYLLKNTTGEKITEGIREVYSGGAAISPSIALKVLNHFQEPSTNPYGLTERELEVLKQLVEGDSYKMIAAHFNLSINTIEKHIFHIYQKLRVNSKGEAITRAYRDKLF
jgi:DNA-binding NarL/FixJ family response regulator